MHQQLRERRSDPGEDGPRPKQLQRARYLHQRLGAAVAATTAVPAAHAVEDTGYEAMLMKCIDPRFTTNTWAYMAARGWQNAYSQFNIAGGPIGVVAPAFAMAAAPTMVLPAPHGSTTTPEPPAQNDSAAISW